MNQIAAKKLALSWIDAWNSHDVDKIASFYHEDCELISPIISEITGRSTDKLRGIRDLKRFWSRSLDSFPTLKMELISVATSVDSAVVNFRGAYNTIGANVFYFNRDNKIIKAVAYFDIALSDKS
jgi:ketosteroid isomerase-like protein